jgi:hypothetical protein
MERLLDDMMAQEHRPSWMRGEKETYWDSSHDERRHWKPSTRETVPTSIMKRGGHNHNRDARTLDLSNQLVRHVPGASRITSLRSATTRENGEGTKRERAEKALGQMKSQLEASKFQSVFNGEDPQDITVHLELPIADDFEEELESFALLSRLGNFKAAFDFFTEHLEYYVGHPFVFVQYANMLLEMGNYRAFEQLDAESVFGVGKHTGLFTTNDGQPRWY